MSQSIYLRPMGILPAAGSLDGDASAGLLPLAGSRFVFSAVEVLTREGGSIRRTLQPLSDLFECDLGRGNLDASALLERITGVRPRLAGLALDRPRIMGIVNVTPDSFSDGGQSATTTAAVDHALRLAAEGADILDIGGESTRPGSDAVAQDEEIRRVVPVIERLRARTDKLISVDTRKAEVMRLASQAGADIINDVSALSHDPRSLEVAALCGLPVMLMHAQGDPKTMNDNPQYTDVALDVFDYLATRIAACEAAGIPRSRILADPGIGFGKHLHHNVAVMAHLSLYHGLGVPVLLGASRKKMIGQLCDVPEPKDRVPGSLACAIAGASQGVQIVRAHDVAATRQALMVWLASTLGTEKGIA